ncbi:maltotransferase domain-containing protein [Salinarimonas ramus]|uniref:Alpha-1,4-glucan:maltose-1-phosphate maltosyltransferase n=1 Tax=Salinarimonas ramus TaxID=690164 RepID=A0A917Q6N3_9HYPH|nr:maltotransferase domain-containing protein [Salinarimonas ramus]GGK31318.1 alpha-1,4-glucan:maltose-1-phosphate maltosyltransferase [Salinarimonas ramus]
MAETPIQTAPRIYYLHHRLVGPLGRFVEHFDRIARLGFTHVLVSPIYAPGRSGDTFFPADHEAAHPALETEYGAHDVVRWLVEKASEKGLALMLDVAPQSFALEHPFVEEAPDCFTVRRETPFGIIDPRHPASPQGTAMSRIADNCGERLEGFWTPKLAAYAELGVAGFRALKPATPTAHLWGRLMQAARNVKSDTLFIADTTGVPRPDVFGLRGLGFDYTLSSLAWWDFRASWYLEEHDALSTIAPPIATVEAPFSTRLAERIKDNRGLRPAYERAFHAAAALGSGFLAPMGVEVAARRPMDAVVSTPEDYDRAAAEAPFDLTEMVERANRLVADTPLLRKAPLLRPLTGPSARVTGVLRTADDPRFADEALLVCINPDLYEPNDVFAAKLRGQMGGTFGAFAPVESGSADVSASAGDLIALHPGEAYLAKALRATPVKINRQPGKRAVTTAATKWPRILVDNLAPSVDQGLYAIKRVVGDAVVVEADALMDGHEVLGVELQWRALDEETWRRAPMQPIGNDRFQGMLFLERMGRHEYVVEAWFDVYQTFCRDLTKKFDAKVDYALDLVEGRQHVEKAHGRSTGELRAGLDEILQRYDRAEGDDRVHVLVSPQARALMREADDRPHASRSYAQPIEAERTQAHFASWYELFPRSMSGDVHRHGTLRDVIAHLPRVRDMGFDVLYFPPIHPIGKKNRKGKNNTLTPGPDDPGSPYAIGAPEGGHDAIHPELGTIDDFRALRAAAEKHGLEIALDFAIQCSPDHPWLKENPGWFDYRPDGSIKYAENPPKKYEDIVNVDFYKPESIPDLWVTLRDIVLFWCKEGVRTFRVDNPHTKPLPFWQWFIADVKAQYPDAIFLSEAFTRPKMMYGLAKIGFTQSYTYFTWRNTKWELRSYFEELANDPPKDFFRPNLFVNTPDINPYYLQSSGRAGFLVRACLAATLGGLWGVYSGFEFLEGEPIPGKEEYKDSEKYEIKARNFDMPGNIVPDITRLNRIRRANPALHTHTNVRFYNAYNDEILYYGKPSRNGDDMILVMVNLNPHVAHECDFEVPLWEFGLPDDGAVDVDDLIADRAFTWHGKLHHTRLDPYEHPFVIWRIRPHQGA